MPALSGAQKVSVNQVRETLAGRCLLEQHPQRSVLQALAVRITEAQVCTLKTLDAPFLSCVLEMEYLEVGQLCLYMCPCQAAPHVSLSFVI